MRLIKIFPFILITIFSYNHVSAQIMEINSKEIIEVLKKQKNIVILDVRTPEEYAFGHLKTAINIDFYHDDFYSRIDKLNKKSTYIVYCRTRNRSRNAVEYMKENGFETVYQMTDGFSGWASSKLPYIK